MFLVLPFCGQALANDPAEVQNSCGYHSQLWACTITSAQLRSCGLNVIVDSTRIGYTKAEVLKELYNIFKMGTCQELILKNAVKCVQIQ